MRAIEIRNDVGLIDLDKHGHERPFVLYLKHPRSRDYA